jgi:hypothetical protein
MLLSFQFETWIFILYEACSRDSEAGVLLRFQNGNFVTCTARIGSCSLLLLCLLVQYSTVHNISRTAPQDIYSTALLNFPWHVCPPLATRKKRGAFVCLSICFALFLSQQRGALHSPHTTQHMTWLATALPPRLPFQYEQGQKWHHHVAILAHLIRVANGAAKARE